MTYLLATVLFFNLLLWKTVDWCGLFEQSFASLLYFMELLNYAKLMFECVDNYSKGFTLICLQKD